jgi:hypothetical protein
MAHHVHLFVKVFIAELEDMLEDIETIEIRLAERVKAREVTDYVYKENETFFHGEERAIRDLLLYSKSLALDSFETMDDLIAVMEKKTREIVKNHENVEALYGFVTRKLHKVRFYVGQDCA